MIDYVLETLRVVMWLSIIFSSLLFVMGWCSGRKRTGLETRDHE